jgi:hypothetical protein
MVSAPLRFAGAALLAVLSFSYASAAPIDLARWAERLPSSFLVHGVKTEPTYQEVVDIQRNGDIFTLVGGAPAWAERSRQSIVVSRNGQLRYTLCPKAMDCSAAPMPTGFLATATLVSASRRSQLHGAVAATTFGGREIICIPAEWIGIARPLFDPCFDSITGAVLAQRHRLTGQFDGPSFEPSSFFVAFKY